MRARAVVAVVAVSALAGLGASVALGAGLVAPKDAGALKQPSVEALVVQAGSDELLVIQSRYELAKAPDALAWAIPVPSAPTQEQCGTASDELFPSLRDLGTTPAGTAPAGVGAFEAKPLDGKGTAALAALQAWLDAGGFAPVREKDAIIYKGAGFAYVGVKVTGKLPASGLLHPFAVRFATNRPYVPLKLLATAGPLDVRLTVLSTQPIDSARAEKCGFKPDAAAKPTIAADKLPKALLDLLGTKPGAGMLDELKKGDVNVLVLAAKLNGDDKTTKIETWRVDPELPFRK